MPRRPEALATCPSGSGTNRGDGTPPTPASCSPPSRRIPRHTGNDVIRRVLDHARSGCGSALVVRGERGIGKTTLVEAALSSVPGLRVVTARGVEPERHLHFAGLQRICLPMLDHLDALTGTGHDALVAALGGGPGPVDRFAVGMGLLGFLAACASGQPIALVIDDVHHFDEPTRQVVAFAARRLPAAPIALVLVTSEPVAELAGLPELPLDPLTVAQAHELLDAAVPGPIDPSVRSRIVAEARGNPAALLTAACASAPDRLAGGFGLPLPPSPGDPAAAGTRSRLAGLPAATRLALVVAAADPQGDPSLLWTATARLGLDHDAVEQAETLGLLDLGPIVTFTDPLARGVVYHDASADDRRRAHRALADAIGASDPLRRVWHAAHGTAATDATLADALERAAGIARGRGGSGAVAAFLERSTLATPQSRRRAERALAAAEATLHAGSPEGASDLLAVAAAGPLDDAHRLRADLLRGEISLVRHHGDRASHTLLEIVGRLGDHRSALAPEVHLRAIAATLLAGRLLTRDHGHELARRTAAHPPCGASTPEVLLHGLVTFLTEGFGAAAPTLRRAVRELCADGNADPTALGLAWHVAAEMFDIEAATALVNRQVRLARETGALALLPGALDQAAVLCVHRGDLERAARLVADGAILSDALGCARERHGALVLGAWRGHDDAARALIADARRDALARGEGRVLTYADYAEAVLHNARGRGREAHRALLDAQHRDELLSTVLLPELVDAAARDGNRAAALAALDRLVEHARACGTDAALGFAAGSRALLSSGPEAEALHREAVERLSACGMLTHAARARLNHGEWLRRRRRRADARAELGTALEIFTGMGADAFADRARRELVATGERSRRRSAGASLELTPQETTVALLAREGRTNREIAERLFISARTVEYHLHKVFTKLGIRSRVQLEHALDPSGPARWHERELTARP